MQWYDHYHKLSGMIFQRPNRPFPCTNTHTHTTSLPFFSLCLSRLSFEKKWKLLLCSHTMSYFFLLVNIFRVFPLFRPLLTSKLFFLSFCLYVTHTLLFTELLNAGFVTKLGHVVTWYRSDLSDGQAWQKSAIVCIWKIINAFIIFGVHVFRGVCVWGGSAWRHLLAYLVVCVLFHEEMHPVLWQG